MVMSGGESPWFSGFGAVGGLWCLMTHLIHHTSNGSALTPHFTGPWSASRQTGATSRRGLWILRKYTTQPPGKSRGECFYLPSSPSTSHFALISPALTPLEVCSITMPLLKTTSTSSVCGSAPTGATLQRALTMARSGCVVPHVFR
jgi:hypothetical protein